jgi:hypothetical protein
VRERHAADADDAEPVAPLKAAAFVDEDDAVVSIRIVREQVILFAVVHHHPVSMPPARKKPDRFGSAPQARRGEGFRRVSRGMSGGLESHREVLCAMDFFVIPTEAFMFAVRLLRDSPRP